MKLNALKYLFIAGFIAAGPAVAQSPYMEVVGLSEGDILNVRSGPGASYADIGDLAPHAMVPILGYDPSGAWAMIRYQGDIAYVSAPYLRAVSSLDANAHGTGRHWVAGIKANDPDGGLIVRASAKTASARMGVLAEGAEVHVIQYSPEGTWAMIVFGNDIGWVSAAYLSATNGDAPTQNIGPNGEPVPVVYSVTGVAADDVLWVRAEPNASAVPLNALAPGAPVSVFGMASAGWAKVWVGQTVGYVNVAYLTPGGGVTTATGLQVDILCRGTEPFWSFDIDADSTVTYTMMSGDDRSSTLTQATPSPLTGSYPYTIAAQPFSGVIHQEICSDGMSEFVYPWSIVLRAPNEAGDMSAVYGCCALR